MGVPSNNKTSNPALYGDFAGSGVEQGKASMNRSGNNHALSAMTPGIADNL